MDPAGASVANVIRGSEGEKFAIGNIYSVKLITGDEFRGIVMAYDTIPDFVGSKPRPGHSKNTRMVNASFITGLSYLGKTEEPFLTDSCWVNLDGLRRKKIISRLHVYLRIRFLIVLVFVFIYSSISLTSLLLYRLHRSGFPAFTSGAMGKLRHFGDERSTGT
ncbi:unnamed protein product [Brassica oleracea]